MKAILYKEFKLTLIWGIYLFSLLSVLVVAPNYPIIIGPAYSMLAIYITFNINKTNKDIEFCSILPVSRKNIVLSKTMVVALLELLQIIVAVPFAVIACMLVSPNGNIVGIDANISFFGILFLCFSVFNIIFLPWFFKTGYKTGLPAFFAATGFIVLYVIFELIFNLIPSIGRIMDSVNPENFGFQSILLVIGIIIYSVVIYLCYNISCKNFEKTSL